jgi:hypothetical protein
VVNQDTAWKHSGFNIHHGGEQPIPAKSNFLAVSPTALIPKSKILAVIPPENGPNLVGKRKN